MKAQEEAWSASSSASTKEVVENAGGLEEKQPEPKKEETKVEVAQPVQSGVGSDWSSVSPQDAANYMAAHTSVSAERWLAIIYHESTNNPTITNSIGCFGYLQLHPVHGNVSQMTPQQYLDTAVSIANSPGGLGAWEVVTNGSA